MLRWSDAERCRQLLDGGPVGRPAHVRGDDQRSVEAGTEPLGQEVVGLPRRERRGVVARVREGESHAEERQGEEDEDQHRDGAGEPSPSLHKAAPTEPKSVLGRRPAALEQAGHMQLVDGASGESQHGGKKRQRGEEDHQHRSDAGGRKPDHVGLADQVEPEERDHYGAPGEQDGTARRHVGRHDCVTRCAALEDALAIAGDDEQRVVDPDADADHGRHLGREVGHREEVREQLEQGDADAEAGQRGDHGETHGHHRAEGQEHDEECRRDADSLAGPGGGSDGGGYRVPPEFDLHAGPGLGLGRGDDVLDRARGDVGRVGGELHLREGDVAVRSDLVRPRRRERARHTLDVGHRTHAGQHTVDHGFVVGDGRRRVEHDVGRVTRLCGESFLEDGERLLRRSVARGELVLKVGADDLGDDGDADDCDDPEHQHEPAPVVASSGQAPEHGDRLGDVP